jgi:hypothetical protein
LIDQKQLAAMWLEIAGIGLIGIVGMAYADRCVTAGSSV